MNGVDLVRALPVLGRTFGADGVRQRAVFELRRVSRAFSATPTTVPEAVRQSRIPDDWPFRPNASRVRDAGSRDEALARAARVVRGEHQAYGWNWIPRPASPQDWSRHPATGHRYDAVVPWYRIPHFSDAAGDIKDAWEPARFGWAYDLARGFMLTRDDCFADSFWRGIDSFVNGCAPFRGVHWSCGQETSIRALAWLWCECAFADAPSTTPAQLAMLRQGLAWSAERIHDGIGYAESQRNNHGISEAAGLIAIGARLLHADSRAERWLDEGKCRLERMLLDQFAADGWYIQHSFTYLRLALEQAVMAHRVLRAMNDGLSDSSIARLRAAGRLIVEVTDSTTGNVPNHGANDGARVLPLSTRPYRDFIPALTAVSATFGILLPADLEPDAETLAWLDADPPDTGARREVPRVSSGESGWVHAVSAGVRVFARAGAYESRPGHIDPLHLDVWIDDNPVAVDAGTFRYAAPPPWRNGLAGVDVHNTVSIEGHPPAHRGPRFLWLSWPRARVCEALVLDEERVRITLENLSWSRLGIRHVRTCELSARNLIVLDDVTTPAKEHAVVLHWLLDGTSELVNVVATPDAESVKRLGDDASVLGWISEAYGMRRPVTSVQFRTRTERARVRFVSTFGEQRSDTQWRRLLQPAAAAGCST